MQYTTLGNTGLRASRLGLGCMRFIKDEENAIRMTHYALDHGVNYLDTAFMYKNSEEILGKALRGGYRGKAILATKCPMYNVESASDFEKYLDMELKALQTEVIDIYMLHNLDVSNWEKVLRYDGLDFLERMVAKGKIRHKACSLHGSYDHFHKVSTAYDWELMTLQMGILDTDTQAGIRGIRELHARSIPVSVMSPLRGGSLLEFAPEKVRRLVRDFPVQRSLQEWAFRFLYDMPEVSVVLSGVTTMEQLKENIRIFSQAETNCMTAAERQLIDSIKKAFTENYAVPCTACSYCMPCPAGVNIPEVFKFYNLKKMTNHWTDSVYYKKGLIDTRTDASQCIECGICLAKCPQEIAIIDELKRGHELLTAKK